MSSRSARAVSAGVAGTAGEAAGRRACVKRLFLVRLSLSSPLSGLMGVVPPADGMVSCDLDCTPAGLCTTAIRCGCLKGGIREISERPEWQAAHLVLKRNSPDLGSSS
jgi:hypothetical protein